MTHFFSIKKQLLLTCCTLLILHSSVFAASLKENRASGAFGETANGFVVARDPAAKADADATNAKRRAVYKEKAAAQGVNVEQVGKIYAKEIIKKVPKGTWIQDSKGNWYQK